MAMADIQGARLRYTITGDGAPLVLLLPQSTGPAGRQPLVDALALRHSVITYDQRGTGGSSPAPAALAMADQAADVVGLLDALGLEHAHLLCHSTGCGIGLSLAASYPERVGALVLAAPWTYADTHLSTMQNLRKAAARALDAQQYARFNAALLFPPEFRRADEAGFTRLAVEAPSQPQDPDAFAARLDAILAFDARPLLSAIRCATLVTVATDDQLMPAWFAAEAASGIDAAEFVEFDGGGHMLPETRTAEWLASVLEFLQRRA